MDQLDKFTTERLKGSLYQNCALVLLGLANMISGAFMLLTSVIVPEIQAEYKLSTVQISILTAILQIGFILGSTAGGEVSKFLGRVVSIKLFLFFQLLAGLAIYLCSNFYVACALYISYGMYNGFSVNILSVYASEVANFKARGRWMIFVNGFLTIGRLVGALLAYFFLKTGNKGSWKLLILLMTVAVAFLFPLIFFTLKESLRYLITNRKLEAFQKIFNEIITINNTTLKQDERNSKISIKVVEKLADDITLLDAKQEEGSYRALFSRKYMKANLLLWTLWFGSFITIFGQTAILPYWFGTAAKGLGSVVLIISAELPIIISGLCLIDRPRFGRIRGLQMTNLITTVFFFLSLFIEDEKIMTVCFVVTRFGVKGVFLYLIPYTAEIYPTPLRSKGLGLGGGVGGLAAVVMPFILFPLFDWKRYSIFVFLGIMGLVGFLASLLLSVETTQISLDIDHEDKRKDSMINESLLTSSKAIK